MALDTQSAVGPGVWRRFPLHLREASVSSSALAANQKSHSTSDSVKHPTGTQVCCPSGQSAQLVTPGARKVPPHPVVEKLRNKMGSPGKIQCGRWAEFTKADVQGT